MQDKIKELLSGIQEGNYKSLARAITMVENDLAGYETLLQSLKNTQTANVVGITGPPGAGKSTLVNALLHYWLKENQKIAVIAVDPSSPFNYGSLLGDRIRMNEFYTHPNIYIRSLATRGALGGLSSKIIEITDVVKNGQFDWIVIETVGVGQSEVEIAGLADCTIVTLVPEAGDEIQTLKAGIMEIADIFVVNKADRENAESLFRSLKMLVHEKANAEDEIPVIKTIATEYRGLEELSTAIKKYLSNQQELSEKRIHLLTEKSWELIRAHRMKKLDKSTLKEAITTSLKEPDFNIYTFTQKFQQRFFKE